MRVVPVLPSVALVVLAAVGTSCGSSTDADGGSAGSAGAIVADASTDESDDQEVAGPMPVTLPAGFPSEIPVPEGVELREAAAHTGASSTLFEVTAWSEAEPLELAEPYEEMLRDLGYEVTSRVEAPGSLFFVVEDDDWLVSAGFYRDPVSGAGTSVGVTVVPTG